MIELEQIVKYAGGFNRSVIGGNAVLKAKHLFDVGKVVEAQDTIFKIHGLCLTMSDIQKVVEINIEEEGGQIKASTCTCVAGLTGRCKHATGLFLYFERY